MWFSRTFERRHSQTETELRPAPIVPFRYIQNICGGVQRTSWRRLVCRKINHSVRPVPSSAPVLPPCLWETQTPFIQISPCTAQSWLSPLYCVSVCALFLRSKATIIVASCPLNECTARAMRCCRIVFVWTLTVQLSDSRVTSKFNVPIVNQR